MGRGGQNDPIIARKHGSLPLLPPLPFLNFRPTFFHDFSRNICFSRHRTGEKKRIFFFDIGDMAKDNYRLSRG